MLNQAESSRRRELQRRAFAAGGGATDAELAELRHLDARAAAHRVVEPPLIPATGEVASTPAGAGQRANENVASPVADVDGHAASASPVASENGPAAWRDAGDGGTLQEPAQRGHEGPASSAPVAAGETPTGRRTGVSPTSQSTGETPMSRRTRRTPTSRRPSIPMLVLSALIALLLGFGGAWLVLGRDSTPAMTSEQAKAMAEIEKTARFDPGSVVYLGEKYDASVWRATSEGGERICLAIQVGDRDQYQCTPPPDDDTAFAEPVGVSVSHADDEGDWSYWATLLNDISGREVVIIQRHDMSAAYGWESQYTDEELRQVRMLEAEGILPSYLQIIGYDGDVPVFISQDGRTCIHVVDPASNAVVQSCEPSDDGVYTLRVNGATYEVRESSMHGPVLTVVRNGG